MNLKDKYLNIIFSQKYFADQCYSVKSTGSIAFSGIFNNGDINNEFSDFSITGRDCNLSVKTIDIARAQIVDESIITIYQVSYKVVEILSGTNGITKIKMQKV